MRSLRTGKITEKMDASSSTTLTVHSNLAENFKARRTSGIDERPLLGRDASFHGKPNPAPSRTILGRLSRRQRVVSFALIFILLLCLVIVLIAHVERLASGSELRVIVQPSDVGAEDNSYRALVTATAHQVAIRLTTNAPAVSDMVMIQPEDVDAIHVVLVGGEGGAWGHIHPHWNDTTKQWAVDWQFEPGRWVLGLTVTFSQAGDETASEFRTSVMLRAGGEDTLPSFEVSWLSRTNPTMDDHGSRRFPPFPKPGSILSHLSIGSNLNSEDSTTAPLIDFAVTFRNQTLAGRSHVFLVARDLSYLLHTHPSELFMSTMKVVERLAGEWYLIVQAETADENIWAFFGVHI
ncbi:uncharacterized protein EV422DRAFT_509350 [Fimicolochytrium jonesii]|uniref:uncharacterized protein n=1 Tax=Fimicolochytrium jonesii TaxID=1396493 RepID=UPI0022FEFB2B|nr:uncharacterized protein EV422DRAFT_509350 [Fimicolochytrium jonesii]KAI8816921.1 hypothetical protein EV422DRAFT_509350 [Fimicolochytrium jonesii]